MQQFLSLTLLVKDQTVIITLIVGIILVGFVNSAYGGAWYPCCFEFKLDKTEYSPSDTVLITVQGSDQFANSSETISVKISDVTYGPDHANVVFEEQKTTQDGKAVFEYKLPQKDSDRYRYLVFVDTPAEDKTRMFFSKKDASKLVVSEVKVLNPVLKQGEPIRFEAKVVDGVGNPTHYARILATGDIPHESCSSEISGFAGAYLDVSPLYSSQPDYWSAGIVKGEIPIMDTAMPGKYGLQIFANGEIDGYVVDGESFQIEIIPTDKPRAPAYGVFAPFRYQFAPGFPLDQPINVTARTTYNGCGPALPNIPIKAELKRYDMQKSQWIDTLATKETTSDKDGFFNVFFEPVGARPGSYTVLLTGQYEGKDHTIGIEFPHNIKNFTISEEGKEFTVTVDGWYFIPLDATFDKENKKLTLELDTSDSFRRVDFRVPHELLDGEFRTVLVNGQERDASAQKYEGYTWFAPWPGEDDHTTIEVIGTSAIPEFPLTILILLLTFIPILFLTRNRFSNPKLAK